MDRLAKHDVIAFDFDHTLIQNPNSQLLWDHIAQNLHKTFWVITFRCHHLRSEEKLFAEFEMFSGISSSVFAGVKFIPEQIFDEGGPVYMEWKGKTAANLGCTVILDDIPEWVEAGAIQHGLEFINPYTIGDNAEKKSSGGIILP